MRIVPLISALALAAIFPACVELDDDPELGEVTSDVVWTVTQWSNDQPIPEKASSRQVALEPFKNKVYMAYTDYSSISRTEILFAWWDGAWSPSLTTGKYTTTRPALTVFNNRLHLFYRPAGETGLKMISTGTLTWTAPVAAGRSLTVGGYAATMPSATVIGGNIYLTYCSNNGASSYVNVDRYDGTAWTAFKQIWVSYVGDTYCTHAMLVKTPGGDNVELLYGITGSSTQADSYRSSQVRRVAGTIGASGATWADKDYLPFSAARPLSVMTCDGEMHLVHGKATSTEVWWSHRRFDEWLPDAKVPNQWSDAGATVGCLQGLTPLMVHNQSGSTQLMHSNFAP